MNQPVPIDALTIEEIQERDYHEARIEHGIKASQEARDSLRAMIEKRLYRDQYRNAEQYCRQKWGFGTDYAYRIIKAEKTKEILLTVVSDTSIDLSERQLRPLTQLEPDQQQEAWREAVRTAPDGKVTGAHVERIVREINYPSPIEEAEKHAADGMGLTEKEWGEEPDSYLGDCYKGCYAPRVLVKGEVYEYGIRGVYVCSGCGYAYPPFCEPESAKLEGDEDSEQSIHFSSETPEWYTPAHIITRVIAVMGEIDLDPCSNDKDNPNVPAKEHYTQEDDGLAHEWHGRVYMNPPYGREIADWVNHLCKEWDAGRLPEAIALVPARTDTVWFRWFRRFPRCFIWGRLKFSDSDNSAPFPSMVVYLGDSIDLFVEVFKDIGDIYRIINDECQ